MEGSYTFRRTLSSFLVFFCALLLVIPEAKASIKPIELAMNTFVFNPRTRSYKAINSKGRVVKSGRASGGSNYCRDLGRSCRTPVGSFRIISKRGANCRSSKYPLGRGGARMPYCMFFSKYYAIHGYSYVSKHNASHGCIRISTPDARWLYHNFIRHGTRVIVKSY